MALKTRKPTGTVPWPLVLIEGEEKAGKTWACAEFTASQQVGRCFWIDLGEGGADEYGAIPGADYEIVEHDGSFAMLLDNVKEVRKIGEKAIANGEKPIVLVIDTMTEEWAILSEWATNRARSSKFNKRKIAEDPNAEIKVTTNYWNDANARHKELMRLLKKFPGIVLMTSHGKQVAVMDDNGQPVEGKKEHKVEAQKTLGGDATIWLRLFQSKPGVIVGGRSVHLQFKPGDEPQPLARDWSLEGVIFGVFKCDPAAAHVRNITDRKPDMVSPEDAAGDVLDPWTCVARIREIYAEAKRAGYDAVTVANDEGKEELLLTLIGRTGVARTKARQGLDENDSWLDAIAAIADKDDADRVRAEMTESFGSTPPSDPRLMGVREALGERVREITAPAVTEKGAPPAQAARPAAVARLSEDEWVPAFLATLGESAGDDALGARREEINQALAGKVIGARVASELHQAVNERSHETRKPVAA
jgi:hypothetical protein